jgi:hypothetical protein
MLSVSGSNLPHSWFECSRELLSHAAAHLPDRTLHHTGHQEYTHVNCYHVNVKQCHVKTEPRQGLLQPCCICCICSAQVLASTCVVSAPIIAAAKERAEVLAKQAADKAATERKHAAAAAPTSSSSSAAEPSKSGAGGKKGAAAKVRVLEFNRKPLVGVQMQGLQARAAL